MQLPRNRDVLVKCVCIKLDPQLVDVFMYWCILSSAYLSMYQWCKEMSRYQSLIYKLWGWGRGASIKRLVTYFIQKAYFCHGG